MNGSAKVYYSISEVCKETGLEPHVLRYWESEFPQLRPKKNRAGNRAYREKDIKIVKYIRYLLYEEKFTIPGAKKKIAEYKDHDSEQKKTEPKTDQKIEVKVKPSNPVEPQLSVASLKSELGEVLRLLQS